MERDVCKAKKWRFHKMYTKILFCFMHGSGNGWRKAATNLTYFLFNTIIRVEREDDLHKEVEDINEC
jgi:hypothetical protein